MPDTSSAAYPFGSPMPGANFGGSQQSVPSPASGTTPSLGGATNPFTPGVPSGSTQAPPTSPYSAGSAPPPGLSGTSLPGLLGFQGGGNVGGQGASNQFLYAMQKAGYGAGVAQQLWNFLQNGAGYNPQVATALWNQGQPQRDQALANIQEQFSSEGLGSSSPAAYGMATAEAQFAQQYDAILAQMYEQSVQNYMQVLLGGKRATAPPLSGTQQFATVYDALKPSGGGIPTG